MILERDAIKWFRPARGQFQIFYRQGVNHLEYQPDFVAEIANTIFMIKPKAKNQMDDPMVQKRSCSEVVRQRIRP